MLLCHLSTRGGIAHRSCVSPPGRRTFGLGHRPLPLTRPTITPLVPLTPYCPPTPTLTVGPPVWTTSYYVYKLGTQFDNFFYYDGLAQGIESATQGTSSGIVILDFGQPWNNVITGRPCMGSRVRTSCARRTTQPRPARRLLPSRRGRLEFPVYLRPRYRHKPRSICHTYHARLAPACSTTKGSPQIYPPPSGTLPTNGWPKHRPKSFMCTQGLRKALQTPIRESRSFGSTTALLNGIAHLSSMTPPCARDR